MGTCGKYKGMDSLIKGLVCGFLLVAIPTVIFWNSDMKKSYDKGFVVGYDSCVTEFIELLIPPLKEHKKPRTEWEVSLYDTVWEFETRDTGDNLYIQNYE